MADQFRELCQELVAELGIYKVAFFMHQTELLERARAALAQPEPEDYVTDEELYDAFYRHSFEDFRQRLMTWQEFHAGARAAIALDRSRRAPVQPVAVSERPWEREGWCDEMGRCWWGRAADEFCNHDWHYATRAEVEDFCSDAMPQVTMPFHALPIPHNENV